MPRCLRGPLGLLCAVPGDAIGITAQNSSRRSASDVRVSVAGGSFLARPAVEVGTLSLSKRVQEKAVYRAKLFGCASP